MIYVLDAIAMIAVSNDKREDSLKRSSRNADR